jgi:hypothetical protein
MKKIILIISLLALTGCGTIVNDPNVPVALSFSDGSYEVISKRIC